jgi:hypothetical protein
MPRGVRVSARRSAAIRALKHPRHTAAIDAPSSRSNVYRICG